MKTLTTSNDTVDGLVLDIVRREIPLSEKQNLVVRKLITEALAWNDNLFDASNDGPTNFESPMQCCTSFNYICTSHERITSLAQPRTTKQPTVT